jgi:N-acetylglutamate synthase-like GNAT family acetyltransferase
MRGDARLIRKLIYRSGINPTGLDWRRFWVVTEKYSGLIACGQIKPHRDGSRELASIAVAPDWRGLGLATLVIEKLLSQAPAPIFLTCRVNLGAFYRRFGFYSLSRMEDMPPYFRLVWRLVNAIRSISPRAGELLVMRRD